MRFAPRAVCGVLWLVFAGCQVGLVAIEDKACDSEGRCLTGYDCDRGLNKCVPATGAPCEKTGASVACSRDVGQCRAGMRTCAAGGWSQCSGAEPTRELCDGGDNDCDGAIDEDFTDLGLPCTGGQGECARAGEIVCGDDGRSTRCSATPGAAGPELCNGKDEDCNGTPDDHLTDAPACALTAGVCADTKRPCVAGVYRDCAATTYGLDYDPADNEARCDGKDNDCDGEVDEGYEPTIDDLAISEVVACPTQLWNDPVVDGVVLPGGNGVPFDDVPGAGSLGAGSVESHAWIEIESHVDCAVDRSRLALTVSDGATEATISGTATARASDGTSCARVPARGRCVISAPAVAGKDSIPFDRIVQMVNAATPSIVVDTFALLGEPRCDALCRSPTSRDRNCCSGEAAIKHGVAVLHQVATPLWPNAAAVEYVAVAAGQLTFSEVQALGPSEADTNGDGVPSVDRDDFVELGVPGVGTYNLQGLAIFQSTPRTLLHRFACFSPVSQRRRALVFGGAQASLYAADFGGAMAGTSSQGEVTFDLPRTAVDYSLTLEDAAGGAALATFTVTPGAFPVAGSTRQSQERCALDDAATATYCACACASSADLSCVTACANACDDANAADLACFSPGRTPLATP